MEQWSKLIIVLNSESNIKGPRANLAFSHVRGEKPTKRSKATQRVVIESDHSPNVHIGKDVSCLYYYVHCNQNRFSFRSHSFATITN